MPTIRAHRGLCRAGGVPPSAFLSAVFNEWRDHTDELQDESDLRAGRPGAGLASHREQVGHLAPPERWVSSGSAFKPREVALFVVA